MGDQQTGRKKPQDFWGIPGSGLIVQSLGTAADVGDQAWSGVSKLLPAAPGPEILTGPSRFPNLDFLPGETPMMPPAGGNAALDALERQTAMLNAADAAKNGGWLSKAMHWGGPALSLAAGAVGMGQGAYGLATDQGRGIDNVGSIISGVADTTAGATGMAWAAGATTGYAGTAASLARFAGPIAAGIGFGVYGERESAGIMQNPLWGDTINNAFKSDDGKNLSMYEAAWGAGGDMIDASQDYMKDTWLGEDVGNVVGTVGGGIGAGATLVGATAANVALGAGAAAYDLGEGAYNLGKGAVGAIGNAGSGIADWWNSDW
ncbi:MAG: hypothetical protein ACKV2T_01100 [Kofleriaceae bacterium]